jgi:stringent starvation protein B
MVPINRVMAIYARENGQGMSFPVSDSPLGQTVVGMDKLASVPASSSSVSASAQDDQPVPPAPSRPTLTRIK